MIVLGVCLKRSVSCIVLTHDMYTCQNYVNLTYSPGKDYPIQASTRDEMLVWIKAIDEAAVSA